MFESTVLVVSGAIPVMASFGVEPPGLGLAGAAVAVLTGVTTRNQFRESRRRHNRTLLAIQGELVRYAYPLEPYPAADRERTGKLALAIETIVQTDAILWNEREMENVAGER